MEIQVKNENLAMMLGQLNALQSEKITLGVKNRIQKIVKTLASEHEPYNKLIIELLEQLGVKPDENKSYKYPQGFLENEEYKEIANQSVTIIFDAIDFNKITEIETEVVYDFTLLSPFFENYN
jgi:signal recognition particle subunit SEC65